MEKEDARKQPREVLHERRKQVIRMHRKGMPVMQTVEHNGLGWYAVNTAITLYAASGAAALKPAVRGRKPGSRRSLSEPQERTIQQIICDRRPEQLKMEFALWNRAAVTQLMERECGVQLSVRGVGNDLRRWGFTPQNPVRKAYGQRPEAVQAWLDEGYPAIGQRARSEGAGIHWGDETAVVNTDVRGRCYAPAGKTPVTLAVGGRRQKLSMIATVTSQGTARWMIIDGAFNADRLIGFLEALIRDAGKKVFLIPDNLRVHHGKPVKAWVDGHQDKMELFCLPGHSPEPNPEERLNADLKQALYTKVPVRTRSRLKAAATGHMQTLEKSPGRVKKFFQDARVKYAA